MQEETIVHNKIDEMVLTVPLGNSTTVEIVESQEKVLSVNEVCKIANISRKTLFYYDKIGLLLPKRRIGSQHTKMYVRMQSINCSRFKCIKMLGYY